nr:sialate O-acetylesterase [uncultured Celeribacter sp.]
MANGVKSTNIGQVALSDEILVHRDGTTGRQKTTSLGAQLVGSGPLKEALDGLVLELGPIYATVAAGLAAVDPGGQFRAASAEHTTAYDIYVKDGGAAVLVASVPSSSALSSMYGEVDAAMAAVNLVDAALASIRVPEDVVVGLNDVNVTATNATAQITAVALDYAIPKDTTVTEFRAKLGASATVRVAVMSENDGIFTVVDEVSVSGDAGVNSWKIDLSAAEGQYLGAIYPTGTCGFAAPTAASLSWFPGTLVGDSFTAGSARSEMLLMGFTTTRYGVSVNGQTITQVVETITAPDAEAIVAKSPSISGVLAGITQTTSAVFGASSEEIASGGGGATLNGSTLYRIPDVAYEAGGVLVSADVDMVHDATVTFYTYTRSGDDFAVHSTVDVALATGNNIGVAIGLEIPAGGYIGVWCNGVDRSGGQWETGVYVSSSSEFVSASAQTEGDKALVRFYTINKSRRDFGGIVDDVLFMGAHSKRLSDIIASGGVGYFGGAGQSNMEGAETAITTRALYGGLTFADENTTLVAAAAPAAGALESPVLGGVQALREFCMDAGLPAYSVERPAPFIAGRAATGSTAIADMSKGTTLYTNNLAQLQAAIDYADSLSRPLAHFGQAFFQGERDTTVGTDMAEYKAALMALAADYDTDSRAITKATIPALTFFVQVTSAVTYGVDGFLLAETQRDAHKASDLLCAVCPEYHLAFADDRHLTAAGSRLAGAYLAQAMSRYALNGCPPEPLRCVDTVLNGSDIQLYYSYRGLVLDTVGVPEQTQFGFRVFDDLGAEVGCTVSVSGNVLSLTPATAPASGWSWTYGDVVDAALSPYTGGVGNLRTDRHSFEFDGQTNYHWALLDSGEVA